MQFTISSLHSRLIRPSMRVGWFLQVGIDFRSSREICGVASNSSASLRRFMSDGRLDSRIDGGGIKSYLFARFLTILTDCSVESQRVDLGWKGGKRGRETYGCLVGSGLSKLAHTDALPEWMGGCVVGSPKPLSETQSRVWTPGCLIELLSLSDRATRLPGGKAIYRTRK
jgi:hypothetical protein